VLKGLRDQRLRSAGVVALLVGLGFGSFAAASAASTPKPSPTCAVLSVGSAGPAVATIQSLVKATADGDFGPLTQAAVRKWQKRHKVAVTGAIDAPTWAAMRKAVSLAACAQQVHGSGVAVTCAVLAQGSTGPAVAVLQQAIGVAVDGQFGPQTAAAVSALQKKKQLTATGKVDVTTWSALGLAGTPACVTSSTPPPPVAKHPKDWKAQLKVRALSSRLAGQLADTPDRTPSPVAAKALHFAIKQTGKPYGWGATGPKAYDCSGLTMTSYGRAAITIPRVANDQYAFGTPAAGSLVSLDKAAPGDLMFFASDVLKPRSIYHVVMYVGGGKIIDAPYTGAFVGQRQLWTQDLLPVALRPAAQLALPVKSGATGWTVTQLQEALDRHGDKLSVDGGFGAQTARAVKAWQTKHGLKATGVVDMRTWLTL
jgi:peptidoglycan hydrolase-like protein with peptidoglycan-binding domain